MPMRPALALLAALAIAPAALAQPAPGAERPGVRLHLHAGPTALSLGEAGAFHLQVVRAYMDAGVRVPTQRLYPVAPLAGADVLYHTGAASGWTRGAAFGIGVRVARSRAYSLYGDYAGALDVVSKAELVAVEAVSRQALRPGRRVTPYLGSRGGIAFGRTEMREEVDLGALGASRSRLSGSGQGHSVEGFGGVEARLGPATFSAQGGYRYARVPRLEGTYYENERELGSGALPYDFNLSGWVVTGGVSVALW
jgi:hypothetical protein